MIRHFAPNGWWNPSGAVELQAVQRHFSGLQSFEIDLREPALSDFAPAIDSRLAFLRFAPLERPQELPRIFHGRVLAQGRPGQRLHGVAPQQFVPIVVEKVARGKDVAPRDFAAVSDDDADDALTFQT